MQNNENDYLSSIKTLINQEEEEAFRIFHKFDFKSRLESRLHAETHKETFFLHSLKKFSPVLGICFLLIILGIVFFINVLHYSPYKRNLNSIQKLLQQTPSWQRFVKNKREDRIVSTKNSEYVEFEWSIKRVLFSVYRDSLSEKNLRALITQFFSYSPAEKIEKQSPEFRERLKSINLDKKIEMLKKRKVVYHFLSKFLNKNDRR
jgi:hypothetical protein